MKNCTYLHVLAFNQTLNTVWESGVGEVLSALVTTIHVSYLYMK